MQTLEVFLKALEEALGKEHKGSYIVKKNTISTITPYIKTYNAEVWLVDGQHLQLIADESITANNDEYNENIHAQKIITKILKYYGL